MQKRLPITLVLLFVLSLFIFFNNTVFAVSFVQRMAQNILSYPQRFFYSARVSFISFFSSKEVETLKEENRALLSHMVEYQTMKQDNAAMRSQFESTGPTQYKLQAARVIGFVGRFGVPHTIIIDKGEVHGVAKDMAVIFNNHLVGKVVHTGASFSSVHLATNTHFSIVAKTLSNGAMGVLKGEEDFILMERVIITDELNMGDTVLTKGEVGEDGKGIPPDLIVGKIASVNKTETKPFQTAKITQLIDYSRLSMVFVVKGL